MGGADQWGNITAGLELIRRTAGESGSPSAGDAASGDAASSDVTLGHATSGRVAPRAAASTGTAYALAYPLLLNQSGAKFGKSETGDSVWLHPDGTSPYAFYQHWLNTDDRDMPTYLRWFSTFEPERIEGLESALAAAPERREAQRELATDLTTRVHGPEEAARAIAASEAAFSGSPIADPAVLATLHRAADGFTFSLADAADGVIGFLVASGTSSSKGEARRSIAGGAITINDRRITEADSSLPEPIAGEWYVVRIGKRRVRVGRRTG